MASTIPKSSCIENNLFDRAAYRMVHIVARDESSMPKMKGNTYVQKLGNSLGQFGAITQLLTVM